MPCPCQLRYADGTPGATFPEIVEAHDHDAVAAMREAPHGAELVRLSDGVVLRRRVVGALKARKP